jgi:hypothetical protein
MSISVANKAVLLYGDSQMQGMAPRLRELLLEKGAASVVVQVRAGLSMRDAAVLMPPLRADVAIVSLGGNAPTADRTQALAQMQMMLALFPRRVAWLTVLPSTDPDLEVGRTRMRNWQKEALPQNGVMLLDTSELIQGLPRRDSVHLTSHGYATLATRVAEAVTAWGHRLGLALALGLLGGSSLAWVRSRMGGRRPRFRL